MTSRSRRGLTAPVVLIGMLAVLGGCGQKGALTLPESARPIKRIETPNASSPPASQAPGGSSPPASQPADSSGQDTKDSAKKDDANGR